MLYQDNKLSQQMRSVLIRELEAIDVILEELVKYADENFMPKVKDFQEHFTEVKILCTNLNDISATLLKAEAVNKLGLTYRKCSDSCASHFGELIKTFQFHDIIQQKLHHLKDLNSSLLTEMKGAMDEMKAPLPYTSVAHELISFYLAQRALILDEYTYSFEEIKKQLGMIKQEVGEVQEVAWNETEAAFFPDKNILDLPDHIFRCQSLEIELAQRIMDIESDKGFVENLSVLESHLSKLLPALGSCKSLGSEEERTEMVKQLNQLFTMESERQLWRKVTAEAGLEISIELENSAEEKSSDIDLF